MIETNDPTKVLEEVVEPRCTKCNKPVNAEVVRGPQADSGDETVENNRGYVLTCGYGPQVVDEFEVRLQAPEGMQDAILTLK